MVDVLLYIPTHYIVRGSSSGIVDKVLDSYPYGREFYTELHTMTAICKLIGILPISLKHCSHDWETNKILSTWYKVHGNLRSLATMDLGEADMNISHHLPVSMQSLVVELSC